MKKLLLFAMLSILLQGCKQYCYRCKDIHGAATGEKCFHTQQEIDNWVAVQFASKPNTPTSCN